MAGTDVESEILGEPASFSGSIAALLKRPIRFVINCNMHASYREPCWGTFEWDVPGTGVWEGN
jgi:hypothetical protein